MRKIDITGNRYGRLVAVEVASAPGQRRAWMCRCDCGVSKVINQQNLTRGLTKSCGCLWAEGPKVADLTGQPFGRLIVIGSAGRLNGQIAWECKCACGAECTVVGASLRSGHTKSCGCISLENIAVLNLSHGNARAGRHTPEYKSWASMRHRCLDRNATNYARYGGRGITICARWNDFAAFLADMGPKPSPHHTIDRIDNNGNYEPDNCRWASPVEQAANRRRPARRVSR